MSEKMTRGYRSSPRPFNSPLECGLRMLFVLDAAREMPVDLQRLVSYDYLLVHSGDVEQGPMSLHPAVPFRGTELLVKRSSIQAGLNQMFSRELLQKTMDATGIVYRATPLTSAFIKLLNSQYAQALRDRSQWVIARFGGMNDESLAAYISENIGRWGTEFEKITAVELLEI